MRFANGDVKRAHPCGRVDYYYAEVGTWQVTHPCGLDVFYFPSGQREGHRADGSKEIAFADGAARRVAPDGCALLTCGQGGPGGWGLCSANAGAITPPGSTSETHTNATPPSSQT